MGIFDIFKSAPKKENNELMDKIQSSIFPGGNPQIEKEIQEVRTILANRYTREDVKSTYIHAAAIYFIATDKSQDSIITSILLNKQSVINKQEAILLYKYLQRKFNTSSISSVGGQTKTPISLSDRIFLIAKGGIVELKTYKKELSDRGKFEVIIFNSLICLNTYFNIHPEKIMEIKDELFSALVGQSNTYGFNVPAETLIGFIQSRFAFYSEELSLMSNSEGHIPGKIYSTFYINPLGTPEPNFDLGEILMFQLSFKKMLIWVQEKTNEI
jgi:hypothetical protein